MNKHIIFTPEKEASRDLTYSEHSSCQQSIHILLQDKGVTNYEFLLKAYRTAISTYLSSHKIESPISFLQALTDKFDALARECRVSTDDFDSAGIHVLISTGKMYWLLSSDGNSVIFGSGSVYTPLNDLRDDAVSVLPVRMGEKQTELFPSSIKDYLRLYAIPIQSNSGREVLLGCGEQERHSVLEYLRSQPGSSMPGHPLKQYLPLKYLDRKVMVISFPRPVPRADDRLPADIPIALAGASHRSVPVVALYLILIAIVSIAAIWGVKKLTSDTHPLSEPMQAGIETSPLAAASKQEIQMKSGEGSSRELDVSSRIEIAPVWNRTFSDGVTSSPVVSDGHVICGCRDGHLYALDSQNGDIRWDYNSRAGIGASPVLIADMVLCANYQGDVFCLNRRDGSRVWNRTLPGKISSSPCVTGTRVIVGCYDTVVYCLSLETGEIAWKFDTGGIIRSTPAANGSLVMVASYDGFLYALSPADGSALWRYQVGGNIDSSPVLSGDELFIGGPDGTIHAIAAGSGEKLWTVATGAPVKSALAASSASLFAGSNDGALYCLDRGTGALHWKYETGDIILARPQIVNNFVFVASYDGTVYILHTDTGEMVDSLATGKPIYCSPRIDSNRIYFGNNAGSFFCIRYFQQTAS